MGKALFVFMLLLALFATDETLMSVTEAKMCETTSHALSCVNDWTCSSSCEKQVASDGIFDINKPDSARTLDMLLDFLPILTSIISYTVLQLLFDFIRILSSIISQVHLPSPSRQNHQHHGDPRHCRNSPKPGQNRSGSPKLGLLKRKKGHVAQT
ncbi:hypothetical protein L2E82_21651 [Cichorium intybus]|uniref:Uncharacterized protein n=1 Tax=Cichorium intybus TaxID=13427 RepID=A0ACB9DX37_CICIN|nr:hypothetical protein L2E82_21651 [Cichorium intybus]